MGKKKKAEHQATARGPKARKAAQKNSTKEPARTKRTAASSKPTRSTQPRANQAATPIPQPFPVVGLGASAGGLEALEIFFNHMPVENGMAFIVIMHQAAKHVSLLPDLLAKHTKMKVSPIQDRTTVEQNQVYIVPPGKQVDLLDGTLHLSDLPERHVAPLPIDYFFRSLAEERREMSVAIVLSGTGTDGTVGLAAIKGEAGMVMVQSVESAKFSGMPQHAIDSGWADFVLPPGEMPEQLMAYARGPFLTSPRTAEKPAPAVQSALPSILLQLRRRCGHDFSGYKTSTISRRIERRMNVHQIDDPQRYHRFLEEHLPEAELLFRDLLIGVTSFFRDPWAFDALAIKVLLPMLKEKANDSQFRVWVPGCSTGEEAYSIAILLRECMNELKMNLSVQIFATDLDDHAIEAARAGRFPSGIAADVTAQRLGQFFAKKASTYRIRKELRDWLVFAPQNVLHDPPFTKLDLITCRNLLIYLKPELQKKLLTLFHYSLRAGGCLFLGTSETISEFDDLYESLDSKAKLYLRTESPTRPGRRAHFPLVGVAAQEKPDTPRMPEQGTGGIRDAVVQMLATEFAPPTVVVNEKGEIVHVHGRTGRFLELAPGGPPRNIVSMAREGLELDLSAALRNAALQETPVIHENVPVKTNGESVLIDLIVQKITQPRSIKGLLRVSFKIVADVLPPMPEPKADANVLTKGHKRATIREKELELELQQNRESLQRNNEALDASNEEMKSANEELQSTNEELQSTNEELETSKEELHSLNEELQTVNAEFQDKIRELSITNDDMNNLLNSTDIATIFLDNTLHIKRYTERAKTIVRFIPTDLGRYLGDLTSHLRYDRLLSDAGAVLKTLVPKEAEVQTEDGRWLLMRMLPYRTADDRIDGLVMTFVDIDESKRARDTVAAFMEDIVAAVREPLLVLDGDLRVRFANHAFYRMFRVTPSDTGGQLIYELGNNQWDIPSLRELLEGILPKDSAFDDFEVTHDFPRIGMKHMRLNARCIPPALGQPSLILLAIEEVKD